MGTLKGFPNPPATGPVEQSSPGPTRSGSSQMFGRPPNLTNKRVLVVGLGRSGIAAAKLCAARGAQVTVTDKRDASAFGGALDELPVDVERELGGHRLATFTGAELIVLSPGVPDIPELVAARAAGVTVTG